MSDSKKYDSVLVGYVDEPRMDAQGNIMSWTVKLKDHELKDILDSYVTPRNAEGKGGNVIIRLFMSKNGKPCASVYNPFSEAAKERRQSNSSAPAKTTVVQSSNDDEELPF